MNFNLEKKIKDKICLINMSKLMDQSDIDMLLAFTINTEDES